MSDVALRAIHRGNAGKGGLGAWIQDVPASGLHGGDEHRMALAGIAENEAIMRYLNRTGSDRTRALLETLHDDKLADAEQKAAQQLHRTPLAVAAAARKRWGRSFTEERDRRVGEQAPKDATPRTLQALRGHVTRALLDELRQESIIKPGGAIHSTRRGNRR